ncbi:MAG: DUF4124 domain-containing protein [Dokdonella sp.]|uniref:DUF4124 domain-containing protein n=1 Tax=Dokdonella sp. TaxID=2291710 RepID=UPI0025C701A6|nr:DUF4124 domain-containing protein [Dokdonella sp.]MBX3700125.1 DUF4124 domain-containing protein [Dokdonella sp.]
MRATLVIALAAAIAAPLAHAAGTGHTQYKWRDAEGALHYSDALPPEAAKFGYEVVNGQGLVIKRVERAKTAAELAAAKEAEAKARSERVLAEQQARDDDRMLSTYPEETDLKRAQQDRLDAIDQELKTSKMSLRTQEQTLAQMLDHAAELERAGKTLPAPQAKQLATLRTEVEEQQQAIRRRERERDSTVTGFQAEIAHYREIKAQRAAARAAASH